jgi:hypothetical protein
VRQHVRLGAGRPGQFRMTTPLRTARRTAGKSGAFSWEMDIHIADAAGAAEVAEAEETRAPGMARNNGHKVRWSRATGMDRSSPMRCPSNRPRRRSGPPRRPRHTRDLAPSARRIRKVRLLSASPSSPLALALMPRRARMSRPHVGSSSHSW